MSGKIDFAQMITAEERAAAAAKARAAAIKAEVQSRIFAVADQNAQASLLAAAITGALSKADRALLGQGQAWIEATKAAGRDAILTGATPDWPEVPEGVAELAARY